MRIAKYLACPVCQAEFFLSVHKKTKERIIDGELKCKECGRKFKIKNGVAYFVPVSGKQTLDAKNARRMTEEQEISAAWLEHFSKKELVALHKEWDWMLLVVKKEKNTVHLDFASGTGRFLKNIISRTKGEIVALDFGYSTCQELQYFLKETKKYSNVSIICADARRIPFKNEIFDSVSTWHGLDEPKMERANKEVKRILKQEGVFVASGTHYQKGSKSFVRAQKNCIRFLTKEMIIRDLRKIGFSKIEHKVFFRGIWNEKGDYLPILNDWYTTYAVKGKK